MSKHNVRVGDRGKQKCVYHIQDISFKSAEFTNNPSGLDVHETNNKVVANDSK